jgi:glycosyltransferase involved in cell wall biosynthesis
MAPLQHIVFVGHSLACGGAERVMCRMADFWAACGRDITIVTLDSAESDFYPLDSRVRRVALGLASDSATRIEAVVNNMSRLQRLRAEIKNHEPGVVISFVDSLNVLTLLATWGLHVAVIISERIDPRHHPIDAVWNQLRTSLYRRANALVVQSMAVRCWAEELAPAGRVHVIPNPVAVADTGNETIGVPVLKPFAVAMGRLDPQKGFDMLIEAFACCAKTRREWSLVIIGEGTERERLTSLAARLGIAERVHMIGRLKAPAAVLREASLFVLSSRYEGFPNALLEAMCCGLPVISFDCPSGPAEIIRHGVDGVLVPPENPLALAGVMMRLMNDAHERQYLGAQAVRVAERFSLEKVMLQWERVIRESADCAGSSKLDR